MNTALLQLRIDSDLKTDLRKVAEYKGIPITALVKMFLKEILRREKRRMLTENGLTEDQELEILRREKEADAGINVAGPFNSTEEMIADLNK